MGRIITAFESAANGALDWAIASRLRQFLLISLLSLMVGLPGLTQMPVTDRDEARFTQASKQMMETGDLIDIRFQDQPRWKKPVGIYWLQAASATVLGGGAEAPVWTYRVPSFIAAWLTALLVLWGARPLIGARGALLAGAMMATTLLMVGEGHIAKTDAALTATAAAALGALAHLIFGQGRWGTALIFWVAIAASILLKGPIVPAIALIAVIALAFRQDLRAKLKNLMVLPGLILTAVLVAPWLIAIWQISDGAFFTEALGKDMGAKLTSGQEKHWGPPGLYLALVWATAWPWAALIPAAAAALWAQRQQNHIWFLAAWLI
ncbi:MAG: glycosyltransferase family 39 protein, partial [Pseudomonadota bacterium]